MIIPTVIRKHFGRGERGLRYLFKEKKTFTEKRTDCFLGTPINDEVANNIMAQLIFWSA